MSDPVLVAIIGGVCAVIGNWLISSATRKKDHDEAAKKEQKTADRLDAIEHKLEVHNAYAEKLTAISTDIAVIKTKLEHLGG